MHNETQLRVLEICNHLGIGWTEKVMQIFCKYLTINNVYTVACGFLWTWVRESLIRQYVNDLCIAHASADIVIEFIKKHDVNIIHRHAIPQQGDAKREAIRILEYCKQYNIGVFETSPFSMYHQQIDWYLTKKIFVSQINKIKYLWKYQKYDLDVHKYSSMYNPLDIAEMNQYAIWDIDKQNLRKSFGISIDAFVIWKIWRANLWKRDDMIIDIVPLICDKISDLKVVVRALPEAKIKKIKRLGLEKYFISLPESINEKDIMLTYQLMDIMLHTSRIGECNSVAINEGMYLWLPICTKSTDFMQRTIYERDNWQIEVIDNGINGYVENNIHKMAQYILEMYKNTPLRMTISDNNKNKALQYFDANAQTKKLICMFQWNDECHDQEIWSLEKYNERKYKETMQSILGENIKAIYEKIVLKA